MSSVTIQRLVDWQDTDAAGHYHHSTVIRWVEAAEAALLDRVDLSRLFGRIPRVRYEVDYLDRLWFGDTASIELSIGKIGRSSIRYDFIVSRIPARAAVPSPDRTVAARGALIATYTPSTEKGSRPWPDDIAGALRGQPTHLLPTPIREV
ncbi:thioesterase family protein [Nocardia sp. XZ_19_385]|uniref:acyl-CoA thioesterase n=1 Tax=Nocardia sp. XZ_19_385 TaxID=2769488 RepID=UPI00188F13FD|nr:acyl-CoA thioesterase [Nocardia sp. XZ_19_385]